MELRLLSGFPMGPASPFLPILILFLIAATVAAAVLVISGKLLNKLKPNNPNADKLSPYECGVPEVQTGARHRYSVKFYLVAMLFILFDVEAAFLLPWAVNFKAATWTFWIMLSFMATLLVGYVYAWGKGALEWEK
jgi:NADH-quinone oxidoreductase subunit A